MAVEERTAGRRPVTWVWMVLALVCVAGFLTWLGLTSEPSSVAIVEEDQAAGGAGGAGGAQATIVPKDTLAANKARYEGQTIQVPALEATGMLGPQVFWGELGTQANQVPILIRMDSTLVAAGAQVQSGGRYAVRGTVQRMTDSIATAWGEAGVLPDEGARLQATFADYYIEATNIRPAQAGGQQGGSAPQAPAQPGG